MHEQDAWSLDALRVALAGYQADLNAAGLEQTTISTYVD